MAGFAVVMSFLIEGSVLIVSAVVLSAVLYAVAKRRAPGKGTEANRYRALSAVAPFLALAWLIAALVAHTFVSHRFAHQSVGFSPDPYITLPNGFTLGSHNTYDGYIVAPGYTTGVPVTGPGYVRSIVDLNWQGGSFTGTLYDFRSKGLRDFTFDTNSLDIGVSASGPFTWSAANDRAQGGPKSYWLFYRRYRHVWPTYLFVVVLVLGETLISLRAWRLGRNATRLPSL